MRVSDLPTPCALVDLERLEANAARMRARCERLGLALRPHVKTHKSVEIARLSLGAGARGLAISTLAEGRALADAGLRDLVWAVPFAPARLEEALALARRCERFAFLLEHEDALEALERAARSAGLRPGAFLELDCGQHRTGLAPDDPRAPALFARLAASDTLEARGLLTHAGHAYAARTRAEVLAAARDEREAPLALARLLRERGHAPACLSIGSTPTLCAADDEPPERYAGLDEARPGNYLFLDRQQQALGSCTVDEIAFEVLASVIALAPARDELVVDAGALALSKDAGPTAIEGERPGLLARRAEGSGEEARLHGLELAGLSQEHGRIRAREGLPRLRLGERLRLVPNHSCLAAAQFERLHAVRGDELVASWPTARGW